MKHFLTLLAVVVVATATVVAVPPPGGAGAAELHLDRAGVMRLVTAALPEPFELDVAAFGTVTVELTLLNRPMVVMGRTSALTAAIVRRAVKLPSFAMPNLIAGQPIVPEFLQQEAEPETIAVALAGLFQGAERACQLKALADVRRQLGSGGAAFRAAEIAEEMIAPSGP